MKLSLETIGEGIKMRELSIDLRQFPSKNANLIKRKPAIGILNPRLKSADYKSALAATSFGHIRRSRRSGLSNLTHDLGKTPKILAETIRRLAKTPNRLGYISRSFR